VKVVQKRQIHLKSKPKWSRAQPNLALLPLCLEILHPLKLASVSAALEEKGYLVLQRLSGLFLQHPEHPWRKGLAPSQQEIQDIVQLLQAYGLDGHCIRTYPEDFHELPVTTNQSDQGTPAVP
jgi:hypothetical protein